MGRNLIPEPGQAARRIVRAFGCASSCDGPGPLQDLGILGSCLGM